LSLYSGFLQKPVPHQACIVSAHMPFWWHASLKLASVCWLLFNFVNRFGLLRLRNVSSSHHPLLLGSQRPAMKVQHSTLQLHLQIMLGIQLCVQIGLPNHFVVASLSAFSCDLRKTNRDTHTKSCPCRWIVFIVTAEDGQRRSVSSNSQSCRMRHPSV